MLDARLRQTLDPWLDRLGRRLATAGIAADAVTLAGFVLGLGAIAALCWRQYGLALVLVLANRAADGLDGAVARATRLTDFGGYLDIVLDFLIYSGLILGFAVGRPEHGLAAAFLIVSFVGTGTSFLAFAALAAKRGLTSLRRGRKSLYYLGGLTEGTETIALLVAICLWPAGFPWLAYGFGALCWVTTASRILAARAAFAEGR